MTGIGTASDFFQALTRHFDAPKLDADATRQFLDDFKQDVGGYSDRVYHLAAAKLRTDEEHKGSRKWPGNGTIKAICREVHAQLAAADVAKPAVKDKRDAWSGEAQRQADRLLLENPALTRMAIAENWLLGLWDFCRAEGRTPKTFEHGNIISEAQDRIMRAEMMRAVAAPTGMTIALLKLARAMEERERGIRQRFEGVAA
jgi:hypothetical protein